MKLEIVMLRPLVLISFLIAFAGRCADELRPHPRLLFTAAGIADLKKKIAAEPWAKQWAEMKSSAEKALTQKLELPPRGGNWSHNYVCPEHAARLKQGKKIGPWEWEHICPIGNHILKGDPSVAHLDFDGNSISSIHGNLSQQVLQQALVFQLSGDERFVQRAREILLAYAERYSSYPMHDNQGRPGKGAHVESQSLSEASWLIPMAQGADLIWNFLKADEQKVLTEKLFRAALKDVILPAKLGIHNIQCRHNSAIGLCGFLLGDKSLIDIAIDDPKRGYRQQMKLGVQADGMWCEGSWGYHFFTIEGVWSLTEAARNCGIDLYGPELKRMFDAPFALAAPNHVLPAFNDSGEIRLDREADLYEFGFARYPNPLYAPLLRDSSRSGAKAFYFGAKDLPPPETSTHGSHNEASGYAVLQRGSGIDATWLCLKYGPHGGGHGHPDKLSFVLYSRGQMLAIDSGTKAYGSPVHAGWDKTTLAHSTLIVDEESQAPATGKCLAFGTEKGIDYAIADAGPIYKGVEFTRAAAMLDQDTILFVDQIHCAKPARLDIAYHQVRAWENLPAGEAWKAPKVNGYKYIESANLFKARNGFKLELNANKIHTAVWLAPGEPTDVITGTGIGANTTDKVPMSLFRRTAAQTAFIWAVTLDGKPVKFEKLECSESGKPLPQSDAAAVRFSSGDHAWDVLVNPSKRAVRISIPNGPEWKSDAIFAIRN